MTTNFNPRKARLEDAPNIKALVHAAYEKYIPLIGRTPIPMLADHVRNMQHGMVWVLEDADGLQAVLELEAHDTYLMVENVAVHPTQQGRGIGKQLLILAEREARQLGLLDMRLYTNELYTANIAMYERFGYVITHFQVLPESTTRIVHMKKMLEVSG